jgi:hypothetical protein
MGPPGRQLEQAWVADRSAPAQPSSAAEEMGTPGEAALLNKILNEMDGLREDAEILFVHTTNRPEALEAALVERPGRIDQAIAFPLRATATDGARARGGADRRSSRRTGAGRRTSSSRTSRRR